MNALPIIKSPRELRLLSALLPGKKSRETLDKAIGASNTPDVVFRLRKKGFVIPCEKVPATDRDGLPCRYGQYRLTAEDSALAAAVLTDEGEA